MDSMDYYPPEWEDDERMRVLLGPMPNKNDSVAFNSRITFWRATLHQWCKTKQELTFTLKDAQMAFRRGTQVPSCLPDIIQLLIREGDLITYEDFIQSKSKEESWGSWTKSVISKPPKWAWSFLQTSLGAKTQDSCRFIDQKVLQTKSESLLSTFWGLPKTSCPFDLEHVFGVEDLFKHLSSTYPVSFGDLQIILHYLAKCQRIALMEHQGKTLLKLATPGETEPVAITEREIAKYQLQSAEEKLNDRLGSLQKETTQLKSEAKRLLLSGSKVQALSLLRRKKRCEKSMEVTQASLENLSICLHQLEEAELNLNVLNAFQMGANALRTCIKTSGCADDVSSAVESLQDVLDECQDITNTISFGVNSQEGGEDFQLEQELEELMINDSVFDVSASESEKASGLPNVPKNNPLRMETETKDVPITAAMEILN